MATGRSSRESQVRRRPPSTGRPAPGRVRPRAPIAGTAWRAPATARRSEPRFGFTLVVKILLAFAVIAFSGAILLAGTGLLSRAVSGIGTSLAGFIGQTEPPSTIVPSTVPLPDAPVFAMPGTTSTLEDTIDLSGSVPASVAGRSGYTVIVSGGLRGEPPEDLVSVPVGPTTVFGVEKVPLKVGVNVLTARIEGPAGDSPQGPQILVIVDRKPPSVKIETPEDGQTVNGTAVKVTGKTQGNSNLLVRNETTGQRVSGLAAADGTFELQVGIAAGKNEVSLQSTDPAGNVTTKSFSVVGGDGKLKASLAATARKISLSSLPSKMTFTAIVLDPDGKRLPGAAVTFSVSVPGIPTLTKDTTTGPDGKTTFTVTIPEGATVGQALATVLVTTDANGDTSAQLSFTLID